MTMLRSVPVACVGAMLILIAIGLMLPEWAMFLTTMAFAKGWWRSGSCASCAPGWCPSARGSISASAPMFPGLMAKLDGHLRHLSVERSGHSRRRHRGGHFGPLLATYRGIFFAMLTLSLSMILYGFLSKLSVWAAPTGST